MLNENLKTTHLKDSLILKEAQSLIKNSQDLRASLDKKYGPDHLEEVLDYVRSIYDGEIIEDDTEAASPHKLDIYFPSKKFAIKFCDLYWDSSANENYKRTSHRDKALKCHENGIKLFLFFEDEWVNKRHLVQQMIKYRLGLIDKKIYARKCTVKEFNKNNDLKDFFNNHHLDGHTNFTKAYTLTYNDEILAAMSIRTNFRGETEIARFATNCNYTVPGAASKLISLLPRPIISFSNNRLSQGEIYKECGFEEITETKAPSYFYTDLQTRVWRFKCKRLNPPKITQEEFDRFPSESAQATGGLFSRKIFGDERPLYRIDDAAHRKWYLK